MKEELEALAQIQALTTKEVRLTDVITYFPDGKVAHGYKFFHQHPETYRNTVYSNFSPTLEEAIAAATQKLELAHPFGFPVELPAEPK